MKIRENNGVVWLTMPFLENEPGVIHGFSSRLGGVSQGDCFSMNLRHDLESSRENVSENFRRIGHVIGFSPEEVTDLVQIHSTLVRAITKADIRSACRGSTDRWEADGLITNEPGIVLTIYSADCVPLAFYDPVHRAIGLSHAGWRGTAAGIGRETVRLMTKMYGSDPSDILAGIGPSICRDCYEVGEDVAEAFRASLPARDWPLIIAPGRTPEKKQLDLWKANRLILEEAGLQPSHIHVAGLCTCCNPEFLFSHRASGSRRGSLASFLSLSDSAG